MATPLIAVLVMNGCSNYSPRIAPSMGLPGNLTQPCRIAPLPECAKISCLQTALIEAWDVAAECRERHAALLDALPH
jgi:hypothetical protein